MYRVALAPLVALLAAIYLNFSAASPASALEAHLFRGLGDFSFIARGLTFSDGMDKLADKFSAAGVRSQSYRWDEADAVYRDIMRRRPDAVVVIGHSMGAVASIALARRLNGSGVRVAYLGTIDIPGPASVVSPNVEVAENFYHAFPVFGHLATPRGYKGVVKNEFVLGQMHVTMDNSRRVHQAMMAAVSTAQQAGDAQTLQAYSAEPGAAANEDLMARVERALGESEGAGAGGISGHAGIDEQPPVNGDIVDGVVTASVDDTSVRRRYSTKSGLPPIE